MQIIHDVHGYRIQGAKHSTYRPTLKQAIAFVRYMGCTPEVLL